jgi:cysteine desulfurase/selenocysteine lyase
LLDVDATGCFKRSELGKKIGPTTALVVVSHVSNVLGRINRVEDVLAETKRKRVPCLIDAAQSVPHMPVDVKAMDCEFLAFSGHKMLGPSGIGVLYVRQDCYEQLVPFQLGGGTVKAVRGTSYTLADPPECFEPGTPYIEGAVALGAAIDYLVQIGPETILAHSRRLTEMAVTRLSRLKGVRIAGGVEAPDRVSLVAFDMLGLDVHLVAKVLNARENVMLRSGFHCAQPLHERLGIGPTARASFYLYNTEDEVDTMVGALKSLIEFV